MTNFRSSWYFQFIYKHYLIWPTFDLKTAYGLKKVKIKKVTCNRFTVLNEYHFYGPKIFRLDKNLNFSKLNLARSIKFSEQLIMIIAHDIFHFEGYWSIFQSLICKLKPIFDVTQMIIFDPCFLEARGYFEVKNWSDQKMLKYWLKDI